MAMSQGRLADSADERQGNIHQRDRRFKALPCVSDNPPWSRPRMFVRTVICRWFSLRATIVAPFITLISAHRAAERQFDQSLNIVDTQTASGELATIERNPKLCLIGLPVQLLNRPRQVAA